MYYNVFIYLYVVKGENIIKCFIKLSLQNLILIYLFYLSN